MKLHDAPLKVAMGEHPDGRPAGFQPVYPAIMAKNHGGITAGIHVPQPECRSGTPKFGTGPRAVFLLKFLVGDVENSSGASTTL
jgi:hypothetical protein